MNVYFFLILLILIGNYCFNFIIEILNITSAASGLPDEFKGHYDRQKYRRAQSYLKDKTIFSLFYSGFFTFLFLFAIFTGFFNLVDSGVRGLNLALIPTGILFALAILIVFELSSLPFSFYNTFKLEQKYGFNKTDIKTFIFDKIKSLILITLIIILVLPFLIWFFTRFQTWGWFFAWVGVFLTELFLIYIWPAFVMPWFNKFEPLDSGLLRKKIEKYANSQGFKIKGIYKMDASRRSAKSNAFFAGFGRFRRVVLFDTLLANHTPDEIISVLAHEIGHYKKKHLGQTMIVSFLVKGLLFYLLSFFITKPDLFEAFGMEEVSVYAGLFFFLFLYAPLDGIFSLFINWLSRKNEKEADLYAVSTSGLGKEFVEALKKLSAGNLSNLTPHPLKVVFSYRHPPVLNRIRYIQKKIDGEERKA